MRPPGACFRVAAAKYDFQTTAMRSNRSPTAARPALLWFRQDLRLEDNPALAAALAQGGPVISVYIWAPEEEGGWPPGGASKWWLHRSLQSLETALRDAGSRLILRHGPALTTLQQLVGETGAPAVFWNRRYEPVAWERDDRIKRELNALGVAAETFNASLLHEPWTIQNKSGKPFQVFTPFWKYCLSLPDPGGPTPAPRKIPSPRQWPGSVPLSEFRLEPEPDWAGGLRGVWNPGSPAAATLLDRFLNEAFADYSTDRDRPDRPRTSRLSPHLHFGEISPRQVWQALRRRAEAAAGRTEAKEAAVWRNWRSSQYVTELGWREFSHHLLHHFPHTATQPLRPEFARFRWRASPDWLRAWQQGRTGFPLVDAGMRELWATGWMHNRVRMVVASFLVKDLLIDWQEGARWFWDTLVDADLAQNTLGWQWTAGCGADAAPFFRIFNPASQAEKFDPEGSYIHRWVPELRNLAAPWVHCPRQAPPTVLRQAGVELGKTYPEPIVSHAIAREVALEAYSRIKGKP